MQFLRSSVSSIHARVQHPIGDVSLFYSGEHFLTFGANFFFSGATFFLLTRFFSFWGNSFSLARLFSLALNCKTAAKFIAGLKYGHVSSKMAENDRE